MTGVRLHTADRLSSAKVDKRQSSKNYALRPCAAVSGGAAASDL